MLMTCQDSPPGLPEDPGTIVSGDVIRDYLRVVDGGYERLNTAVNEEMATRPVPTVAQWTYTYDDERPKYLAWRAFYVDAIDDILPWGATYSATRSHHVELLDLHRRFKIVFGKPGPSVPGIPVERDSGTGVIVTVLSVATVACAGAYVVSKVAPIFHRAR